MSQIISKMKRFSPDFSTSGAYLNDAELTLASFDYCSFSHVSRSYNGFADSLAKLDEDVKAPNIFERAKEEIEAVIHTGKINPFHKETHRNRDDIDENTPLDVVKAPNVFERVKEEVEALVQTIQQKKDSHTHDDQREHTDKEQSYHDKPENGVKVPKLIEIAKEKIPIFIEKAKEEMGSILHHEKSSNHHKETHGKNDYIDETTPLNEVKAPNVFERAKEELEAIVGTIHPKMGSNDSGSSPKEEKEVSDTALEWGWKKYAILGVARKIKAKLFYGGVLAYLFSENPMKHYEIVVCTLS